MGGFIEEEVLHDLSAYWEHVSKDKDEIESEGMLFNYVAVTQTVLRPFVLALSEGKEVTIDDYMDVGEAMAQIKDAIMGTTGKRIVK
jgi:hypothetical protein